MKRLFWFVNRPWVAGPILLRAIKVSHHRRRLEDAEHIAWAKSLLALDKPARATDTV